MKLEDFWAIIEDRPELLRLFVTLGDLEHCKTHAGHLARLIGRKVVEHQIEGIEFRKWSELHPQSLTPQLSLCKKEIQKPELDDQGEGMVAEEASQEIYYVCLWHIEDEFLFVRDLTSRVSENDVPVDAMIETISNQQGEVDAVIEVVTKGKIDHVMIEDAVRQWPMGSSNKYTVYFSPSGECPF
jgi:hypothetical protein